MPGLLERSGLVLWIRGDRPPPGLTDGANIASWPSMRGGISPVQATEADKPSYSATGGPGGKPGIRFDVANSEIMTLAPVLLGSARNYGLYAAFRTVSQITGDWSLYSQRNSGDADPILCQVGGKATATFTHDVRADDNTNLIRVGNQTHAAATNYVLHTMMTNSSVRMGVNGVWGAATAYVGGAITTDTAAIGAPATGGLGFADIVLSELLIYNRAHADGRARRIIKYLGSRYGIAIT